MGSGQTGTARKGKGDGMSKYQATRIEAAAMLRDVRNAGWLVKTITRGREFELFGGAAGFARLVVVTERATA